MFFLTPIIAGIMIVGTLGAGGFVEEQARDVVAKYNLFAVAHLLEINYVETRQYPASLEILEAGGEVKNLKLKNYTYKITRDGQKFVLGDGKYCYKSDLGVVESAAAGCGF